MTKSSFPMDKDKILDNFTESRIVRFFAAFLNNTWVYGSLSYTDFNFEIMSFNEFVDAIKREIDFTMPYEKESEERMLPFKLYLYVDDTLTILTEEVYLDSINKPNTLIFCTQDEENSLNSLKFFKESPNGIQFFS